MARLRSDQRARTIITRNYDVCLFVFISSTMRFSGHGLGASDLATHNQTYGKRSIYVVFQIRLTRRTEKSTS
jgi:hypothetical protein